MANNRKLTNLLQKAVMYDALGHTCKHWHPNLYIHSSLKHIKYFYKALNRMQISDNKSVKEGDAKIRILHASEEIYKINVDANRIHIVKDMAPLKASDYISFPSGLHNISIIAGENNCGMFLNKEIKLDSGKSYTLAVVGKKEKIDLLTFENLPEVPADETKIRFLHLSFSLPSLDFAVKDRDVVFPNISYQEVTDYLGLTPMTVDLELRTARSKEVVLPMPRMRFTANEAYTLVLAGSNKLIILKD